MRAETTFVSRIVMVLTRRMSLALQDVREILRLRISAPYLEPGQRFRCPVRQKASQARVRRSEEYRGLLLPCCGRCAGRGVAGASSHLLQVSELQFAPWPHPSFQSDIMISFMPAKRKSRPGRLRLVPPTAQLWWFALASTNCCSGAATINSKSACRFLALSISASCCVVQESGADWDLSR